MANRPTSANPSCFKCDAESPFLTWIHPTGWKTLLLLYCGRCGAVQGVVTKGES